MIDLISSQRIVLPPDVRDTDAWLLLLWTSHAHIVSRYDFRKKCRLVLQQTYTVRVYLFVNLTIHSLTYQTPDVHTMMFRTIRCTDSIVFVSRRV